MKKRSLALMSTPLLFLISILLELMGWIDVRLWSPTLILTTLFFSRWAYVVASQLRRMTTLEARLDLAKFTRRLVYICVAMACITIDPKWINPPDSPQWWTLVMILLQFPLFYWLFYSLNFLSKSIAQAETQKPAKFDQYAGYFFCLFFFPPGIWWVNVRIKNLLSPLQP